MRFALGTALGARLVVKVGPRGIVGFVVVDVVVFVVVFACCILGK
jgi:hypothetical protein